MPLCGLTGLPVYDALPDASEELFADNPGGSVEAVLVDVDGLVYLTDMCGFASSDTALVNLSHWLAEHAQRHQGAIFRVRGEEFLLLFPGKSSQEVFDMATQLVQECARQRFPYERFDDDRKFLAINAVVFTAESDVLAQIATVESDVSGFIRQAVYDEKTRAGKKHSVVVRRHFSLESRHHDEA